MEKTIFDYSVTAKELKYLRIPNPKEIYLAISNNIKKLYDLYVLFIIRENDEESNRIMAEINKQITNPSLFDHS